MSRSQFLYMYLWMVMTVSHVDSDMLPSCPSMECLLQYVQSVKLLPPLYHLQLLLVW